MRAPLLFPALGAVLWLSGCSTTTPQEAFAPVQEHVASATGQRVTWNQGTEDDRKADESVRHLLRNPLDATTAAQIALLQNPDLQATFEEIGISQAELVQAGLLQNPVFAGSWRFPNQPPGLADVEYSVAQNFLSILILPLKQKIAKANLEATQDRVTHEVLRVIGEVKEEFYTYQCELQLEQRLQLMLDAAKASAELAKAQQNAGAANTATSLAQQTQYAGMQTMLFDSRKEQVRTREKLQRLMGLTGDEPAWTARKELSPLPKYDPPVSSLEKLALTQRRDLLAARRQVDALGEALALKTNTRYFPAGIDVGVDSERQTDNHRITGPTLSLELPIFDQGQGEIGKLAAEYRQAKRQLEALEIRARSEVREARGTLQVNRDQVFYFRKETLPLQTKQVDQALLQYNAMNISTYDLFQIKQQELEAEREYLGAWRDYWISRSQLETAVGGSLQSVKKP